jgi:hypothetical protein
MSLPITFSSAEELVKFAQEYLVKNRLSSLNHDVKLCLDIEERLNPISEEVREYLQKHDIMKQQFAPFPALEYCFSIIDLLGSLNAGHARSGNTTENARNYTAKFMKTSVKAYEDWQITLLQKFIDIRLSICPNLKHLLFMKGKL